MSNSLETAMTGGVVATGAPAATNAGAEIFRLGGNAVDAAVAAALAICVADPANASLLGRCHIVVRTPEGQFEAIDGASAIPSILPETIGTGPLAWAAIPCLPQALEKLHAKHGRLSLSVVASPAAQLADEGLIAPEHLSAVWALRAEALAEGGAGPYANGVRPPEHFRHPQLSRLLRAFGVHGAAAITTGQVAELLVGGIRARGGYWATEDLEGHAALEGEVLHGRFRDCEVTTIGRQGWGHTFIEMLAILDRMPRFGEKLTAEEACRLVAVIEACFEDRPQRLGSLEPKVNGLTFETLVDPEFLSLRAAMLANQLAEVPPAASSGEQSAARATEDQDTTHLSTLDNNGLTVALTMSIGPHFGLRATDTAFGLLPAKSYRMSCDPVPGARDVTEMTPVIVTRGNRVLMSLGGAGSERIPGAVAQAIVNVVDRGYSLDQAVRAPRVNVTGTHPRVHCDAGTDVIAALRARWPNLQVCRRGHENHLGLVQAVGLDSHEAFEGVADDSWDGTCVVVPSTD